MTPRPVPTSGVIVLSCTVPWRNIEGALCHAMHVCSWITDVQVVHEAPGASYPAMLRQGGRFRVRDLNGDWHVFDARAVVRALCDISEDRDQSLLWGLLRHKSPDQRWPDSAALAFWDAIHANTNTWKPEPKGEPR